MSSRIARLSTTTDVPDVMLSQMFGYQNCDTVSYIKLVAADAAFASQEVSMSRSRMAVAALLVPVTAGAVALLGAGAASAARPYSGDGYVGVRFDQNETRFLADTNAADFLNAIPGEYWGVYSGEGSVYNNGTIVRATIGRLVDETANHQGQVSFSVNNPAIWTSTVDIVQEW